MTLLGTFKTHFNRVLYKQKMQLVRFLCTISLMYNYFRGPVDQTWKPVLTWVSDSVVFKIPPQGQLWQAWLSKQLSKIGRSSDFGQGQYELSRAKKKDPAGIKLLSPPSSMWNVAWLWIVHPLFTITIIN